ncbi:class I SAM-dependent methyltransferase [Secundilactobacillus oryzae]|uniref:class I SAM-dependent methyltransferase n=1 Tax=Secundilactobacillus oryzae TaxID=1202668 RepID=UPI0025B12BCF|nr:class I SAM-dependent methyltransferase [Secundilactobacillus oryzae]
MNGKSARKFEGGYPVIDKDDLVNPKDFTEGEWIALVSHNHFVAKGYFAKAGRGIGWILSIKENEDIDERFFSKLFRAALMRRQNLLSGGIVKNYRLFNGIGDGLGGLTIDVFENNYVIAYDNDALYQQNRLIMSAFNDVINKPNTVIVRRRGDKSHQETNQIVVGDAKRLPSTITENGIQFPIDLTGTPVVEPALEYRHVRQLLKDRSDKSTYLNLFAGQSGLTIAAAVGGALKTVTVDDSKRTIKLVDDQLALNQTLSDGHETRAMAVFGYLDYAIKHELQFDTVSVNPPAFLRGKKRDFSLQKDLEDLLLQAATVTKKGGELIVMIRDTDMTEKKMNTVISELVASTNGEFKVEQRLDNEADFTISSEFRHADSLKAVILKRY